MPDRKLTKTVLELDLASYGDVARVLEEHLDVMAVKAFEDQIQAFVDRGLETVNLRRADVVLGTAGDNAILIFDRPEFAHEFASVVQAATVVHNASKTVDTAKRWFRIGAATGTVLFLESERRIVGSTVARAVRLEAAAAKGELVVDLATYNGLPENLKLCYGTEHLVRGKRNETFRARRCKMIVVDEQILVAGIQRPADPLVADPEIEAQIETAEYCESVGDVWKAAELYEKLTVRLGGQGNHAAAGDMKRRAVACRRAAASLTRGDNA